MREGQQRAERPPVCSSDGSSSAAGAHGEQRRDRVERAEQHEGAAEEVREDERVLRKKYLHLKRLHKELSLLCKRLQSGNNELGATIAEYQRKQKRMEKQRVQQGQHQIVESARTGVSVSPLVPAGTPVDADGGALPASKSVAASSSSSSCSSVAPLLM